MALKFKIGIRIILVTIFHTLIFLSCRKETLAPKLSREELAIIKQVNFLKAAWKWDSTAIFINDSLKFTYTTGGLKMHSKKTFSLVCVSPTTLTLNFKKQQAVFENNVVKAAATDTVKGYVTAYEQFSAGQKTEAGAIALSGLSLDSTYNLQDTWMWLVYPDTDVKKTRLYLKGNVNPRHACSIYSGWLILINGSYLIDNITQSLMKLIFVNSANAQAGEKYIVYFHR